MFRKVLIANRGAVAVRIARAVRALGARPVFVYSEADRSLPYLQDGSEAYFLGESPASRSYLHLPALMDAIRRSGADAVHPGYGFLSESPPFARSVAEQGCTFVGPSPRWIEAMGHKTRARDLMIERGMPVCPSSPVLTGTLDEQVAAAVKVGFPLLVKPAGGGGGIGMIPVFEESALRAAIERASQLASRAFSNGEVYVERLLQQPRHVEFQLLADRRGRAMHLFERDCSVQRRHQKVIEEAPAPGLSRAVVRGMADRVTAILGDLGYDNLGTVETLHDAAAGFSFLEMNTRLQVEHGVTEEVTGIDLVQAQLRLADGEALESVVPTTPELRGHALQVRVYAEDPSTFMPSPGRLETFRLPSGDGVRLETGYAEGCQVTPFYDPMLAKLIVHGTDRDDAIAKMESALASSQVSGVKTNIPFLRKVLAHPDFRAARIDTGLGLRIAGAERAASLPA